MYSDITDTTLFPFTQPQLNFGQRVQTDEGDFGYVVGLDFYPETCTWVYGIYPIDGKPEVTHECWYDASQLEAIGSIFDILPTRLVATSRLFQFTQPDYHFGDKVQTEDSGFGYIVGLDFSPDAIAWAYGVYLLDEKQELIEESWYSARHLTALPAMGKRAKRRIYSANCANPSRLFPPTCQDSIPRLDYPSRRNTYPRLPRGNQHYRTRPTRRNWSIPY
jgi:hypothetical protein